MGIDPDLVSFVYDHCEDDLYRLTLQRDKYPHIDLTKALRAIQGRRKLLKKHPHWAEVEGFFVSDPIMVEQSSSIETARYKCRFLSSTAKSGVVVDLSGGLGVDTVALASISQRVIYLDSSSERVEVALWNFSHLGRENIDVCLGRAQEEGLSLIKELQPDLIYIDPDRRPEATGNRAFLLEDCEPNILELLPIIRTLSPRSDILVKLSPMIDLDYLQRSLGGVCFDVHVVSLQRECKEVLLHLCASSFSRLPHVFVVEMFRDRSFYASLPLETKGVGVELASIGTYGYAYDLYPSVAKVGDQILESLSISVIKPHKHTHLYFTSSPIEDFPGRGFKVLESGRWTRLCAKRFKGASLHLVVKNFPERTDKIREKLRIKEGGGQFLFLFSSEIEGHMYMLAEGLVG